MDIQVPSPLFGGISPARFMRQYWQRKPLLVRLAFSDLRTAPDRSRLIALAAQEQVESRLVQRDAQGWKMRRGPFARRMLPPFAQRQWTLLVQGVDLEDDAAHAMLQPFRFVPDARLDDLMVSYATDGGGVGPHFDSYDVFLLQTHGQRRWRIGRQKNLALQDGVPLKILAEFEPEAEYLLSPGDMLYLPPRYAHDGVAVGECITCSIGFRAPRVDELARELLQRLAEDALESHETLYADRSQPATATPGALPAGLRDFAQAAIHRALADRDALPRVLGEYLTEPKAQVWFDEAQEEEGGPTEHGVRLDRRTRMLYDDRHVFINGESYRAGGRDAALMHRLADTRRLPAADLRRASDDARTLLAGWCEAGWVHTERSAG